MICIVFYRILCLPSLQYDRTFGDGTLFVEIKARKTHIVKAQEQYLFQKVTNLITEDDPCQVR